MIVYTSFVYTAHNASHGFIEHEHNEETCQLYINAEKIHDDIVDNQNNAIVMTQYIVRLSSSDKILLLKKQKHPLKARSPPIA